MKKILISDFSRVQLFPKDSNYYGGLNKLYDEVIEREEKFNDYFVLNEALLNQLDKFNFNKYIFTTGKVQNAKEINNRVMKTFKEIFNVPMIGYIKTDPNAYTTLCKKLDVDPHDVIFIDDLKINVEASIEAGLHGVVYKNNEQIVTLINEWLN